MSETQVTTEVQFENSDDLDAFEAGFFGQKSPEETPASATTDEDAEQDTDSKASEGTEAQTTDDDEQDEAELKEAIPETPKRKTVQDRIDEVVRQREELRRESASQIEQLRKELEDFKKGQAPTTDQATAPAEPTPDALKEDGSPVYALGEFDPQFIRDLTRFTLQQERAKVEVEQAETQRQAAVQQAQQALTTEWNGKVTSATQAYPDFVEKSQTLLDGFSGLDPNYAGYLSNVLMSMEKGPDVLYYLSNHPDEATAIVNSGAQKATLALGRIESRFIQSDQVAPKPKITKAPAPPVERARGTNGAFISVAPDTDDLDAFEREFFQGRK